MRNVRDMNALHLTCPTLRYPKILQRVTEYINRSLRGNRLDDQSSMGAWFSKRNVLVSMIKLFIHIGVTI